MPATTMQKIHLNWITPKILCVFIDFLVRNEFDYKMEMIVTIVALIQVHTGH